MKPEEFQKIKSEYNKIMDLMQERTALRGELEAKVDTYINLSILDSRLEYIEDHLFEIDSEDDIYTELSNKVEFEMLECGTDKKLYFFYGYCIEDYNYYAENYFGEDHVIFLPRDYNFKPFINYYVLLFDVVNTRKHVLIPLKKYEQFKKDNYVFDIGEEIDAPYNNLTEYNAIKHDDYYTNYDEALEKLRTDLYKCYVQSDTEKEAVMKLVNKYNLEK